jgi:hypothetical protein
MGLQHAALRLDVVVQKQKYTSGRLRRASIARERRPGRRLFEHHDSHRPVLGAQRIGGAIGAAVGDDENFDLAHTRCISFERAEMSQ